MNGVQVPRQPSPAGAGTTVCPVPVSKEPALLALGWAVSIPNLHLAIYARVELE